jgi:predicted acyl esterase
MEYLFRKPTGSLADRGAAPPRYRREDAAHPFFDDFWASKAAPLSRITVLAYVVANWSD